MKKISIVVILILVLSSIFVFCFKDEISLFYCNKKSEVQKKTKIIGYKKEKTLSISQFLSDLNAKNLEELYINKKGDVAYKDKVILTFDGIPLNDCSAYTKDEMLIMIKVNKVQPKEGCDPDDIITNGFFGCYIYIPDEEDKG
jgi:hypothetical protein